MPNCSRRHQAAPYVRPEHPNQRAGEWRLAAAPEPVLTRWQLANPLARLLVLVGVILLCSAAIVLASIYAGDAAADGFGPLLPVIEPSVTPYPGGWTPGE